MRSRTDYRERRAGGMRVETICAVLLTFFSLTTGLRAQENEPPSDEPKNDLAEKLIKQATGEHETGVMADIMRLMSGAAERLVQEFDPGTETQATQQEIVRKLDEAIASAQRRKSKSSSSAAQTGERRTSDSEPSPTDSTAAAESQDATPDAAAANDTADQQRNRLSERFREARRGWGHLPARDRDEVLQGIDEEVLEKYRSLIEDYFQALAEDETEE